MKERVEQENPGFSRQEYEKLNTLKETEAKELREFLDTQLGPLHDILSKEHSEDFAHLCVIAAHELHERLQESGLENSIVEGELELSPHNWLSHRITVVQFSDYWVVLDLTARQLPWFKGRSWLCELVPPNREALQEYLIKEYRWWDGKKK